MTSIYCLYSTADGRPRYIGQTTKAVPVRHAQHLRDARKRPATILHKWICSVTAQGFQVRAHTLQLNVSPAELNLFERYWMTQFISLLNCARGTPVVKKDTAVAIAVCVALRRHVQTEGPRALGAILTQ